MNLSSAVLMSGNEEGWGLNLWDPPNEKLIHTNEPQNGKEVMVSWFFFFGF